MKIRNPVVAGRFYAAAEKSLEKEVSSFIEKGAGGEDAIGVVSPHAGYMCSGPVAGSVLGRVRAKSHYVIMGPNHTGIGSPFSIDSSERWRTPLGEVGLDSGLIDEIKKNCALVKEEGRAHAYEHSVEVQLPFLQYLHRDFRFVPLIIAYAGLEALREIGRAVAKSIKTLKIERETLIIASSDMTHYEPYESAKEKDAKAIEAILRLDEEELARRVEKFDITMCGIAPACVMLAAAKELGAKESRLVKYETSGETTGDYSSVVGYAGIIVS